MIKKIISLLILTAALSSCGRFLDIKPYDKTIPETAEDFSAIIHELCNEIDNPQFTIVGSRYSVEGLDAFTNECCCDNLEANLTEYPVGNMLGIYVGDQCSNGSIYKYIYATIARSNIVIDNLKGDAETQEVKDVLGTAYAFRGISYYQLIRLFCPPVGSADEQLGVPLLTEFDMESRPLRGTLEQTIELAESDMKKAIGYDVQNESYYFNSDVMKGYLARLYFWCQHYKEAKELALELLQRHPLIEGEAYKAMMTEYNDVAGNMLFRTAKLDNSFSTQNAYVSARPISIRYIKLFEERDRDIRYNLFIGKLRKNKKVFSCNLRSAELALIAMESACHLGETEEALGLLNDFRGHRIEDYTPYTMGTLPAVDTEDMIQEDAQGKPLTPLLYAILCERRKEMYMEDDRFFELKRNGRPEFWAMKKGLKYYTRKFMYTFALPASDIQLNPDLRQNPGYSEMEY